jgi:hypothetical protein
VCPYTSASPCVGIPGANRKGGVLLVVFEACPRRERSNGTRSGFVRVKKPEREPASEARLGQDVVVPRQKRSDGHWEKK